MRTSDTIEALSAALAAAQGHFPAIKKTKTAAVQMKAGGTYRYTYADLGDILDAVRPVLTKHGLAVTQGPALEERTGLTGLTTRILHASGQWVEAFYPMDFAGRAQEVGSAITYARRYSLSALLGIAAEDDDDGTMAQHAEHKPKATTTTPDRTQRRPESTHADDADAAPGDKFVRGHVTAVEERTGTTRGKAWTVYLVTVAGQKAGTFDRGLADEARAAFDAGEEVDAHLTPGRKAGTWELASLVRVVEPADGHLFEDGGNDEPF